MEKHSHYRRLFLNLEGKESSAHLIAEVGEYNGSLQIADCSRKITLSFGFDEEDWENSRQKIELLKAEVVAFEKALKKARRNWERLRRGR